MIIINHQKVDSNDGGGNVIAAVVVVATVAVVAMLATHKPLEQLYSNHPVLYPRY